MSNELTGNGCGGSGGRTQRHGQARAWRSTAQSCELRKQNNVKLTLKKITDSVALNLAAEEESHLRREADARIKDLGVTDLMLLEASNLFEKVKIEKLNDHGKPWKAPPPVTFSTEYWREWQKKVKVDKGEVFEKRRRKTFT